MSARPFLRIAEHEVDDHATRWRGWLIECRAPGGGVVGVHPAAGLHGTQSMAYRAAVRHLHEGGCPVDGGGAP